ncbi:hypothetical protein Dsin_027267 [Dipteronia sinensis]|uniref:Gnk2-homologous domain-containing protein n=1 Tax=Dipteronia sinensis TaxID=43782 RepID=A0AAE0DTE8_9ROSI|nr:hypothetical protein Dsin_027267 [Dipteronia sinensis]
MTKCPYQKEAFMWGGDEFPSLVHYVDHSISEKLDLPPVRIEYGGNLTEHIKLNLTEFDQIWDSLTDDFQMIYSLMQCTPDLSQSDCDICLRQSVADFQACCRRSAGGKVLRANCYIELSLNPFYSRHTNDTLLSTIFHQVQANITFISYRDVFSFGVLLLETVSGQKRCCFSKEDETNCLLTYAWKRWNEGTVLNVIDSTLREGLRNEMMKCVHIGLLCVRESVSDRPSMASVVHMLNRNSVTLQAPSKPGFFMQNSDTLEVIIVIIVIVSIIEIKKTRSTQNEASVFTSLIAFEH